MPTQSRQTVLLAPDKQNTVLIAAHTSMNCAIAYTPYGDSPQADGIGSQLRFNGELREATTSDYPLGQGYRLYNPRLMRFISPDGYLFSPFGKGGFNAYVYCGCDPINNVDLNGHFKVPFILKRAWRSARKAFKPASISVDKVTPAAQENISNTPRKRSAFSNSDAGSTSSGRTFPSDYESSTLDPDYGIGSSASLRRPNPIFTAINGVTYNRGFYPSEKQPVSQWLTASNFTLDQQLDAFTQIPRAGAGLRTKKHMAVQVNGVRRGNVLRFRANEKRRASDLPSWLKY